MRILIHITGPMDSSSDLDLLVDEKMSRIIFKIKKHYMICVWNKKSINFNMSKTVTKNTLIYRAFNKENWEQEAKKCNYRYLNQVSEN